MAEGTERREQVVLGYGPRVPWYRRRWFQRVVQVCLVVVGLGLLYWVVPYGWRRGQIEYWRRKCEGYTLPAGTVVYETEETALKRLWAEGGQYRNEQDGDLDPNKLVAAWAPKCWTELSRLLGKDSKPGWVNFRASPPILFVHERTARDGSKALVVVQYHNLISHIDRVTRLTTSADYEFEIWLVPRGAANENKLVGFTVLIPKGSPPIKWSKDHEIHRFYAGQEIPGDASGFQFDYETDAGRGTIRGHLLPGYELELEGGVRPF